MVPHPENAGSWLLGSAKLAPLQKFSHALKTWALTVATSQLLRFWLKTEAPSNMELMTVTASVSQPPMAWLKEVAPLNLSTERSAWCE